MARIRFTSHDFDSAFERSRRLDVSNALFYSPNHPGHKLLEVRARHPSKERLEFVCYGNDFYCLTQNLGDGNWGFEVRLDGRMEDLKKVRMSHVQIHSFTHCRTPSSNSLFLSMYHTRVTKPIESYIWYRSPHITYPFSLLTGQKLHDSV